MKRREPITPTGVCIVRDNQGSGTILHVGYEQASPHSVGYPRVPRCGLPCARRRIHLVCLLPLGDIEQSHL